MIEKNIEGKKFGKLVALKKIDNLKWIFKCECGKEVSILKGNVLSGHTKSCGCLKIKHGHYKTRLHNIWSGIKARCSNKKDVHFKIYGLRGIKVCEEWKNSFQNFYDWAIKNGYQEHLTIDRIDVNGNYCQENCRWATPKEQANNRRNNHKITYNGETHSETEWEKILGFNRCTFYNRKKKGWNIEKIINTPIKKQKRRKQWEESYFA